LLFHNAPSTVTARPVANIMTPTESMSAAKASADKPMMTIPVKSVLSWEARLITSDSTCLLFLRRTAMEPTAKKKDVRL